MLAIFLAIVTYTIDSKTAVSSSGDVPSGVTASYSCSYQKGDITKGNSATLVLEGCQHIDIQSVTLYMKSNKESGAGMLTMTLDDVTKWEIPNNDFCDVAWTQDKKYTTDWVPIDHTFAPVLCGKKVKIEVTASENSLHISHYCINYTAHAPRPYTVDFYTNTDSLLPSVTENSVGEGVLLPWLNWQKDSLHFLGWMDSPCEDTEECPSYYIPGSRYYPQDDVTLYALYSDYTDEPWVADSLFVSGDYMIAWPILSAVMCGEVNDENKTIPLCDAPIQKMEITPGDSQYVYTSSQVYEDDVYHIDFITDSTLTIFHPWSKSYVGFKQKKFSCDNKQWKYCLYPDHSIAIYTIVDKVNYMFRLGDSVDCVDLVKITASIQDLPNWYMYLFSLPTSEVTYHYTSNPLRRVGLEDIFSTSHIQDAKFVQIGCFRMRVQDQQKYINID